MNNSSKPEIVAGLLLLAAAVLLVAASPDLSGVREQQYAELVLIFTSIVAATSLYFIHDLLSEVMKG